MPSITCPGCGREHTVEEYEDDRFCRACGSLLRVGRGSGKRNDGWRRLFPYEPYPPQVDFIRDIQETAGRGGVLVAEACNGFGKTISVLSCLLPMGKRIIYGTRTHEQVRQVLLELEKINEKSGESYTAVNLASRDHLCVNPECRGLPRNEAQELCNILRKNEECPYVSDLDKPPRGLPSILSKDTLVKEGRRRRICPYYLARRMMKESRVVVAPYPYIFNPMIRLATGLDLEGRVLVLDEGHNIDKVGQEILSDTMTERGLSAAAEEMKLIEESPRFIERLGEHLLKSDQGKPRLVSPETLQRDLELALGVEIEAFIDGHSVFVDAVRTKKMQGGNPPVSYLNGLLGFFELLQTSVKDKYVGVYTRSYYGAPVIEYRCLDPSLAVVPVVEKASGAIVMSGTLSPLDTFSEILGLGDAVQRSYPSIQKSKRIRMIVETGVTTTYRERTDEMITRMGEAVSRAVEAVDQGVLLFFTQRGFMNTCLDVWESKGYVKGQGGRLYLGGKQLYREGTDAKRNRDVVTRYKRMAVGVGGAVLCCVFRGRNSEGSNFPGDQARGIVLVGVPYANYGDPLVKAQIRYYNRLRRGLGNRWYTMDAYRAANQSLGRGIRGRDDWCHYWLLDRRYEEKLQLISRWAQGDGAEVRRSERFAQQTF
jgi:regulator of telomere elongation helicase 1